MFVYTSEAHRKAAVLFLVIILQLFQLVQTQVLCVGTSIWITWLFSWIVGENFTIFYECVFLGIYICFSFSLLKCLYNKVSISFVVLLSSISPLCSCFSKYWIIKFIKFLIEALNTEYEKQNSKCCLKKYYTFLFSLFKRKQHNRCFS